MLLSAHPFLESEHCFGFLEIYISQYWYIEVLNYEILPNIRPLPELWVPLVPIYYSS